MIGGGSLTVNNTVFTNNVATGNGGAIYMSGSGTLPITDSTFGGGSSTGNQAVNGAAIYQVDSTSAISGGSIAYNTARGSGGAVYLTGNSASLTVSNAALLTHNTANQYGGGSSSPMVHCKLTLVRRSGTTLLSKTVAVFIRPPVL